ncbi:phage upper tail fiber protein [Sinorhizobium medicae]
MERVGSPAVSTIVKLTQAQYNALGTKDANTLYIIVG